jgi:7-carboxy-7-deazaguanine synthase
MKTRTVLVSEIFGPTIQGEGALVGRSTVFVRTGGCDFECEWCDTLHAVLVENKPTWKPMHASEIMRDVCALSHAPCLVTLSGGNPALQPLAPLIDLGHSAGFTFAMETQGTVAKEWFGKLDYLILSPKPPSSGMPFNGLRLRECIHKGLAFEIGSRPKGMQRPQLSLKVVVMNEEDYQFARDIYYTFATTYGLPMYLTPGNHTPPNNKNSAWAERADEYDQNPFDMEGVMARTRWLVERIKCDRWYDVSIIPQLHTLIWRNQQGV